MNITQKVRLFFTLIFLLILGLFIYTIIFDQIKYREEVEQNLMVNIIHGMHSNIEHLIGIIGRSLDTYKTDMPEWLNKEDGQYRAKQRLLAFNTAMPTIEEISIFEMNGTVWASSKEQNTTVSFTQEQLHDISTAKGEIGTKKKPFILLFEPEKNENGIATMKVVLPIYLENENFAGGVLAILPTNFFLPVLRTGLLSADSMTGLTWNDKKIFLQVSQNYIDVCLPITEKNTLINMHFASGLQLSVHTDKNTFTNSKRTVAMYTMLKEETNWSADITLTIGRDHTDIIRLITISARSYILLYLLICVLTLIAIGIINGYEKKSNLQQLTYQKKLEFLAQYDQLTGLKNRTYVLDSLKGAIARAQRKKNYLTVMFIDLDSFKEINDTWGHDAGDQLLRCMAENMKTVLRDSDTLARFGGDEFLAILEDVPTKESCIETATRLLENATKTVYIPYKNSIAAVSVTASIGIVFDIHKNHSVNELITCADTAMYEAKQSGKNRFAFYEENKNTTSL